MSNIDSNPSGGLGIDGSRLVVVHPDADVLAEVAAARLLVRISDVQAVRTPVHVVLTGGTLGIEMLRRAAASPLLAAVDWSTVHMWWGDERFLPDDDPERNETQAREALLDALMADYGLPPSNVHPMPGPSSVNSPEQGSQDYAEELARFAASRFASFSESAATDAPEHDAQDAVDAAVPAFDVLILGMGPDGHIASLFPHHDEIAATGSTVAVHGSPKPPSTRISLTFGAIRSAREVWMVVAGAGKAASAATALGIERNARGSDDSAVEGLEEVVEIPAVGARGLEKTLWLIDVEAATG